MSNRKNARTIAPATALFALLVGLSISQSGAQNVRPPVNLDLTSANRNQVAGGLAKTVPLTITVGGEAKSLAPNTKLTAAERVAAIQMFQTGKQEIVVGADGTAVGGSFTLAGRIGRNVGDLVIPEGVTAYKDFGRAQALNLSGSLTNSGNFFAVSTNPNVTNASISALNINNGAGALISSVLPVNGLPAFTNAIQNLSLTLTAVDSIVNQGSIFSAANLNLMAGGSITNGIMASQGSNIAALGNVGNVGNVGNMSNVLSSITSASSPAVMQAVNNINLNSAVGNIMNAGTITSVLGNLNIAAQTSQNLSITNGGVMQALAGNLNIGEKILGATNNIDIKGGTLAGNSINMFANNGVIMADLFKAVGPVNTYGTYARVAVHDGDLNLGTVDIAGDPIFFNTKGNVILGGNISVNERLAIVASKDVKTTAGVSLIQARDLSGQGFDINIIAGANVSGTGPITINGASATGGNIDFTASPTLNINANSTGAGLSGGNVTLAAFSKGNATTGRILLSTQTTNTDLGTTINASGNGAGANGNITIIAGATSGEAIRTGAMTSTGGAAGTGNINITNAQPTTSNAAPLVIATNGNITSGNTLVPSGTIRGGSVIVTNNLTAGNAININTGGAITALHGVVATVPVGESLPLPGFGVLGEGVALNHAGTFAYVANLLDNSITVIRISDNTVVDTIQLFKASPSVPKGIFEGLSVTPDDQYLFATTIFGKKLLGDGAVYVIRTSDNTVVSKLPVPNGSEFPAVVTFNQAGTLAFVSNEGQFALGIPSTVTVYDVGLAITDPANSIIGTIPTGLDPFQSAVNPAQTQLWVVNATNNNISIIDIGLAVTDPQNSVIQTIPTGADPHGIVFHPSGAFAYVANATDNNVWVIDTSKAITNPNKSVVAKINTLQGSGANQVGQQPLGVSIDPAGTFLYVNNARLEDPTLPGSVSIISTANNKIVQNLALGPAPAVFTNESIRYSGNNIVGYYRNEGNFNSLNEGGNTASAIRLPSLIAPTVALTTTTGSITVGTTTSNLTANAGGTTSNVAITSNSNITLGASRAGNVFQVGTTGTLNVVGPIQAKTITLFPLASTDLSVMNPGDFGITPGTQLASPQLASPQLPTAAALAPASVLSQALPAAFTPARDVLHIADLMQPANIPTSIPKADFSPSSLMPRVAINTSIVPTDVTGVKLFLEPDGQSTEREVQGQVITGKVDQAEEERVSFCLKSDFDEDTLFELIKSNVDVDAKPENGKIRLRRGSVLFAPPKNIVVSADEGDVHIDAGSVALVISSDSGLSVLDLHDGGIGDVHVVAGNQTMKLAPGHELFLTKETRGKFTTLNPAARLGFRNLEKHALSAGLTAYVAEFPIIHALQYGSLRGDMTDRSNDTAQRLLNRVLKSAASIHLVTQNHGRYKQEQVSQ